MRPVTVEDADELSLLEMELFPDNCLNEYTIAREIDAGGGLVICDGWAIVAYMLWRGNSYLTDIMRLGVRAKYQGCGLGSLLLTQGVALAEYVMLTVVEENDRALRLYRRYGFEIVGRLRGHGWVMGLTKRTGRDSYFIGLDR